jgi:sodium-dependent dicarboxylate transporter 2/3/5
MHKDGKLWVAVILPLMVWFAPVHMLPLEGMTVVEQRLLAIFVMAALFWVLEPIPVFATSLLIVVCELVLVSDKGFVYAIAGIDPASLLSYRDILGTFAAPIIMLFLGGFFLAMAATKYRLDQNLARVLLKPFGSNPKFILLGLMVITAVFSMFMSNTATTAMMLAILMPVLKAFEADDSGKVAFALGIPFAANIGGIGTPIGTPPNAVAMKYLGGAISFGKWMSFALPYVFVMLVFAWILLSVMFPCKFPTLEVDMKGRFLKHKRAWVVYVTSLLTIVLWLTDFLHGMNAYVVAMIPVAVFSATQIITSEDLKLISWDVLWLVAGGIALGQGLEQSGLAARLVSQIPFENFSPLWVVGLATGVAVLMATLMSNTATANLLLPMIAVLGASLKGLDVMGGSAMLIVVVTISCSLAMALPVSTPPNAMAHATGVIKTDQMFRCGIVIGIAGLMLSYVLMFVLTGIDFW